jgi:MerR family transcriptional regulator, light-induced transcriptional regulator
MAIYSIKDLEKLSGIKAHTLRIWEQRYSIIMPKRTKTNIRYYTDTDLRAILNVALLNKNGYKISKISELSSEEISEKVASISEKNFEHDTQLDALTISMIEMDEYKFDRIISTNIQQLGFEKTMMEVIHPFLDKLGLLWLTGSIHPVQENFMAYLIRQKIIVAIDNLPLTVGRHVKKYLLYLPEGETQELSLLFMHYLLKSRQNQVIYIGQNMSIDDLRDVYQIHKPDYMYTMITETFTRQPVARYIDLISNTFPASKILLSGYQIVSQKVESKSNVLVLKSIQETIAFLEEMKNSEPKRSFF